MKDKFQQLLVELSHTLNLPLQPDKVGACSLLVPPELVIQIQLDVMQENLFFFSKIIDVLPGKFRENVLREALKTNAMADPRAGVLAYFVPTNHLILFQRYPLFILNGESLAGLFGRFLEMAQSWCAAIKNGQSAPSPQNTQSIPFGIKL